MTLRAVITMSICVFFLATVSVNAENVGGQGKDSSVVHPALTKPVYEELTMLIKSYYPGAKVSETGGRLHFEFKSAPLMAVGSNRPVVGPKEGGILGDVEFKHGTSQTGPKTSNEYYYLTETFVPYSANHDCHLVAKIAFPTETSSEFLDKFKAIVRDFDSLLPPPPKPVAGEAPKATAAATAAATTASASSASASTVSPPAISSSASSSSVPASNALDAALSTKPIASAVAIPAVSSSAATPQASAKPPAGRRNLFFWKARKGPDVVYLLGTIHAAPSTLYPLPREIEAAFEESKCLIVEVDITKRKVDPEKVKQLVATSGKYTPPDKLSKHLSPSTKRVFEAYLNWAGESWAMYDEYKPWYARELISVPRRGDLSKLRKAYGIDVHFLLEAALKKKPIDEFETVEFQLALDSKMAPDVQDKLLQVTLLEMKDTDTTMASIFEAWKAGDMEKMERTAVHQSVDNPELIPFTMALLNNRNVGMAAKIEPFLKTKGSPLFVAVGSAHMVGETGLVNLLKKKGFDVEQVTTSTDKR